MQEKKEFKKQEPIKACGRVEIINTEYKNSKNFEINGIVVGSEAYKTYIAVCDGEITFTGFLGGGGYTITLSANNFKITYCHMSPNFIVKKGDFVKKGQIIGHVGPKNVYGVPRKPIQRF